MHGFLEKLSSYVVFEGIDDVMIWLSIKNGIFFVKPFTPLCL